MIHTRKVVYNGEQSFADVKRFLGKRPGNYHVDAFYIRQGMGKKPYFWDDYDRKWVAIRLGDSFYFDEYGIAVMERE